MNNVHVQNQKLDKTPYPFSIEDVIVEGDAPRLENGDRLTRAEFERRYDAMPNLKKAELIKGVVSSLIQRRARRGAALCPSCKEKCRNEPTSTKSSSSARVR
jgi:hypothetical protein